MFLTKEILEKYYACEDGIKFFEKHFPDGAELSDVIQMRFIPVEFLYWGFRYLDTTPEEKELYAKVLKIENSSGVFRSKIVSDSNHIVDSEKIKNSSYVFSSEEVTDSKEVVGSQNVENSIGVFNSSWVFNSARVAFSTSVNDSTNIANSQYIAGSKAIIESDLITDSQIIRKSSDMSRCVFCANCKGLRDAMFCTDQNTDTKFLLFNKPVEEVHFKNILNVFKRLAPDTELNLISDWQPEFLAPTVPQVVYDVRRHYSTMSQKFMKWLRTLPNYDPHIMYQLTYLPEFVKEF